MNFIDNVCKEYNITYYLTAGTLLGAVRHKGFIPWDDDLDIVMPREDYEKFIKIMQEKNYAEFSISTMENDLYPNYFSKVSKNGTVFMEDEESNWGIFVDIFPLDDAKEKNNLLKIQKFFFEFSIFSRRRIVSNNKTNIFLYYIAKILPINAWNKIINKIVKMQDNKDYQYYANFGSQYSVYKQTMPKDWFIGDTYLTFENTKFHVPKEYDKVLKSIYGNNYMEIPPKSKRITHQPKRIVFSDGEEMS